MPWFHNFIPEYIKKSVCTCLIKRYLSHFIENEITRDQLNLDLLNGRGTVEKIRLAVESLNELGETQNWPVDFVDGYIEKIFLDVPWTSILSEATYVEIQGLRITVQPKQRKEDATSMFESMWNSMTSSMQLAEEYAKEEAARSQAAQAFEGVELFAQTIESIVGRVKIKFIDTVIQVEHVPKGSLRGVGLVINIDLMEYFDESNDDPSPKETPNFPNEEAKKAYVIQSFTTKKIAVEGLRLSSMEFSSQARTFSRSVIESSNNSEKDSSREEEFFEADNGIEEKETKSEDEKSETAEEVDNGRQAIVMGKIYGKQEVRIKVKQSENLTGPKVAIELNLGSVLLFLSPRQFHVILELIDGFSSPDMEDVSNVAPKAKCTARPMTQSDYQRVEQELQNIVNPLFHGGGLQGAQGWSSDPMDGSLDESFLPMKDVGSGMYDSTMSGFSGSVESSFSSSMGSSVTEHSRMRRRASNIDMDPTADISRFQVRLAALAFVLLHEDLITVHTTTEQVLVAQMQNTARAFFEKIGHDFVLGLGRGGFENVSAIFEGACSMNHLRLLAAPVQLEADEKTTLSSFSISGHLSAARLQLLECLRGQNEVKYVPLLKFDDGTISGMPCFPKPNLRLRFRRTQRTAKNGRQFPRRGSKTEAVVSLTKCAMELDISLVDRLTALLNQPPVCLKESSSDNTWCREEKGACSQESELDLKVCTPCVEVRLRFPVPDFKPAHDLSKVPWWERNVRPDWLSLVLNDVSFETGYRAAQEFQEYKVSAKGLDVYYFETENSAGLHIGRSTVEDCGTLLDVSTQISLYIKIYPKKSKNDDAEPEINPMAHSCYGAFENQGKSQPGPFGAKKVVHESDTPHSKLHEGKNDSEELIIPGDKEEIEEFIKSTLSSALILVEVSIPSLSAQLKSKHMYELIYNRINNDLLLWAPSAPKPNVSESSTYGKTFDGKGAFVVCKSAIQYDSESESEDDSENGASIFYSTYEKARSRKPQRIQVGNKNNGQSEFVLNLNVGCGLLTLNPPVRDATTNNVLPEQQGEFELNLEDANIFVVSGYRGDENLGYVCVQLHNARLNHCDMQLVPKTTLPLKEVGSPPSRYLQPTIYRSDPGALTDCKNRGGKRELFTLAVKIQASHETHHVKTIQLSLGLNKATLRYRMCREPNTWISQLLDFFNANDYPIAGYKSKDVVTELNLHLWDCAIDYRPLHLPIRSAVTVGSFSLSSHLTAASHTSTLRFIFEECGLLLSERAPPRNGVASIAPIDLRRDYVNVMELSLFEISLKTADKKCGLNPHIDFRASNNLLNIRTCADSGKALMQLITYFANDGDFTVPEEDTKSPVESPSKKSHADEALVNVETRETVNLSKSQHEQVCEMLHEAMEDDDRKEDDEEGACLYAPTGAKLFFFPDEKDKQIVVKPLPQVTTELGDITYHYSKSKDSDDEFCFVGNEPGLSLFPKDGRPEIVWHASDTVRIRDNHFAVPIAKKDLLQPPKGYPTPVTRYTLCEMSLVWQMFGGHDFKTAEAESAKKEVRFADKQLNDAVSFSKSDRQVVITSKEDKKRGRIHWAKRGGPGRDHAVLMELQLNKVRFQHEVYPETTTQASRQVLLISDVEIRDRLETSQLNKFLYQYTSQSRPKKAHSNMVVIKALHIRPDLRLKTQECCLKVSLLPIRLNIDQDSLLFLINFFKELGGGDDGSSSGKAPETVAASKQNTPVHHPPVMTINEDNEDEIKQVSQKAVNDNLILLMEESKYHTEQDDSSVCSSTGSSDEAPVYFRKVIFSPEVLVRLDYHGKRVDLSHGPLAGLLMGLGHLNCSELRLKRVVHRHGLLGAAKLVFFLLQEWLGDIKRNQLSTILGGVGPMHALLQLFQGVRDLFWLPIEQYQKDGRIVRGLQRGANSFTTSTAMAALELTTRLIYLIQVTAETAYDMLSPGPSIRMKRIQKSRGRKKRYQQPQDIREGLTNAVTVFKEGIGETADNIVQIAAQEREQKGYCGAVGGVLRQLPPTVLKPVIMASEAAANVLGGVHSQLAPDARREANEKWRGDET